MSFFRPFLSSAARKSGLFSFCGGVFISLALFLLGFKDLALGFFLGCFASVFNFWGLESLTRKIFEGDWRKGIGFFWFFNLARWVFFLLVCWLFWKVSPSCFLGGCLGYFWCLAVLLITAWRSRTPDKIS
jgi:hypothetical protein